LSGAYLIIDIGTGNSRVVLTSWEGHILDIHTFENNYYRDYLYDDGQYFLPWEWSNRIFSYIKKLIASNPRVAIKAITSTSARESIVLLDKEGSAFYGLPNVDNRGVKWLDDVENHDEIYRKTGRWVNSAFSASKLMGLKKFHMDIYERIVSITSLSEWIGYLFTSLLCIEPSQACETQLFDIETYTWSKDLCKAFGVDSRFLPGIQVAATKMGNVKEEICMDLGLMEDVPFITGGADTQLAVKGIHAGAEDIVIVSGTTSPIVTISKDRFYDPKQRCWIDCYIDGHSYQIETNAGVTGLNYQRIKKLFFPDEDYAFIDEKIREKTRPKCIASFGTLVFSENRSLYHGGFYMGTPLDENLDRFDFAYAIIADIACSIYQQYKSLCDMVPFRKDYILGCGGGFQSTMLCQMIADLTGKTLVIRKGFEQSSVLGCVKICNDYFKIPSAQNPEQFIYKSNRNACLEQYYVQWRTVRDLIN